MLDVKTKCHLTSCNPLFQQGELAKNNHIYHPDKHHIPLPKPNCKLSRSSGLFPAWWPGTAGGLSMTTPPDNCSLLTAH
jgi:hypothetical protein